MDNSSLLEQFATDVVRHLQGAGSIAYWAGGCVRDQLRGIAPKDFDVATTATPDQVRELFGHRRTIAVGASFGVMIVLPPKGGPYSNEHQVEVATFRQEGVYLDGRRPESVQYSTPEQDALRRDFTINGLFKDPLTGRIYDYVGGQEDLQKKVLRAIGNPVDRMAEDKLRLLRAVRFAASLQFQMDEATVSAVRSMADQLSVVSKERIAQELRRILTDPQRLNGVQLCRDLGLMESILPGWLSQSGSHATIESTLPLLQAPGFPLTLAVMLQGYANPAPSRSQPTDQGTVRSVCRFLKLSNEELEGCCWLHAHQSVLADVPAMDDARLKTLLAHPLSAELLKWLEVQARLDPLTHNQLRLLQKRSANWTTTDLNPPHLVTGQDLLDLGIRPGPIMKTLLDEIRTAQLNGQLSSRDQALLSLKQRDK